MRSSIVILASTIIIAAAMVFLGISLETGLAQFRLADRSVAVKGLAERDVKANVAIWSLPLAATNNDLAAAQAGIDGATRKTFAFLQGLGFADSEIKVNKTEVIDLMAQEYRANNAGQQSRYIIRQYVQLETPKVDQVVAAQGGIGALFKQGVVVSGSQVKFVFNGLNAIKPEMIAEATKNAREGAEQFARDSKASLGGIKTANQGQFQILPADSEFMGDEAQSLNKKIRVVTTVEYILTAGR